MRALTPLAEKLMAGLAVDHELLPGYHGTGKYCLAIRVADVAEAFKLGMVVSQRCGDVGAVSHDLFRGHIHLVVFQDALVAM